jgi:hypothetical protein
VFIITSLDSKTHNFKIIGLLAILCLVLCSASVRAADNSSILVSNPYILVDPIGNHTVGDVFFINGTTNWPVTEPLRMEIINLFLLCCTSGSHRESTGCPESYDNVVSVSGISISPDQSGSNRFSVNVTDKIRGFESGIYIVDICSNNICNDGIDSYVKACSAERYNLPSPQHDYFTLFPVTNISPTTTFRTIPPSSISIQPSTSQTIVPITTQSSSLPLVLPIVVLSTIVILRLIFGKKYD